MNSKDWFKKHFPSIKKAVIYQNLKYFIIPTLSYEYINPDHKILVTGIKKKKYRKGSNNHERIALLIKELYFYYFVATFMVFGWLVFCRI